MLRNPAYRGRACYGKTELRPRQRITRALRKRGGLASRDSANHERPRPDWIEIAVPALISEETFALAQEQLEQNKRHSPRRTIEPSLLQGMLVCELVAMHSIALPRAPPRASFITTGAWVRMPIAISGARFAITRPSVRITWMRWSGRNSCGCWRTRA